VLPCLSLATPDRSGSCQTALHLGADPRHKTIADFLAAIERRRNLAQPPREGALHNLAMVYGRQGKYGDAEELNKRAA
jgi:hypothetical protein